MRGRPRRISRQKFPKRTCILSIPSKPYSFHSVHSAIGSRMNGMIFRSFRKRNSSQKNTNTVYSEYSYSGIVPKERTLLQLSVSKCAASFPIAFSWLSSHYENSKSTSRYLCELKQILVDFLRAFNRGKFLPGS